MSFILNHAFCPDCVNSSLILFPRNKSIIPFGPNLNTCHAAVKVTVPCVEADEPRFLYPLNVKVDVAVPFALNSIESVSYTHLKLPTSYSV